MREKRAGRTSVPHHGARMMDERGPAKVSDTLKAERGGTRLGEGPSSAFGPFIRARPT